MTRTKNPLRAAALTYADRGWRVFPLQVGGKTPLIKAWQHKATTDRATIRQWWRATPNANVAIICDDTAGPVVLDIDGADGAAMVRSLDLPATLKATTASGKRHLYFAPDGSPVGRLIRPVARAGRKIALDVLGSGGYVVAPPSVVAETGNQYTWLNAREPQALPSALRQLIKDARRIRGDGDGHHEPTNIVTLPDVIHEGGRDTLLTSLAGSMRRRGASGEAILAALRVENDSGRLQPPLADKDLRKIARSIATKRPDGSEPAYFELNEKYAVVKIGGDTKIMEVTRDGEEFLSQRAFELWLKDRFVDRAVLDGETKREPLTKGWLSWEGRRRYERIGFKPGSPQVANGEYNLWRGWAITPSPKGSCDRFLSHLRDVVCRGNAEHFDWLLDWFADIVQHPQRKVGIAVALKGPQGAGKSIVGRVMSHILGRYQTVAEKPEHVVGRFNGHLAYCLLLQAEEAFWGGDRNQAVLKHLVTGEKLMIERKGVDSVEMANYTRLFITSNSDWIWPTDLDDRRLVIFDVKGTYARDTMYFDHIAKEMFERGGCARLLHELLTRQIDDQRLRSAPVTKALQEQAEHTMSAEETWLRDLLDHGVLPRPAHIDEDGFAHVPSRALHEHYRSQLAKGKHVKNPQAFAKFIEKHLPRAKNVPYAGSHYVQSNGNRARSRVRVIQTLAACRDRYSRRGRAAPQKWPKRAGWNVV